MPTTVAPAPVQTKQACARIVTKDDSGQEKVELRLRRFADRDIRRGCNPPAGILRGYREFLQHTLFGGK